MRNSRTGLKMSNLVECEFVAPDFVELKEYDRLINKTKSMLEVSGLIKNQFGTKRGCVRRFAKSLVAKFGKGIIPLDKLLAIQMNYADEVLSVLRRIVVNSRRGLKQYENYVDYLVLDSGNAAKNKPSLKKRFNECLEEHKKYFALLERCNKAGDYIRVQAKLIALEREIAETRQKGVSSEEKVNYFMKEGDKIKNAEIFYRNSIHFCELIEERVGRFRDQLVNTLNIYFGVRQQRKVVSSLSQALDWLIENTDEMQEKLVEGIRAIGEGSDSMNYSMANFRRRSSNSIYKSLGDLSDRV